ncbi:hypothetical protein RFF05_15975 [Bengtsoniella intestinalis]|uniref:hypothetical protein n=1 Tax=Bengtsoniella intestinalis TaxID=3073143 RepID=UPI00391FA60A
MWNDFNCPKCGSEQTVRTPIELLSGIKSTFYILLVISVLGIAVYPMLVLISVVVIILGVIVNIIRKIIHRNHWLMKCQRCKTEYYIVNPDKAHVVKQKRDKQQKKQESNAEKQLFIQRRKAEILARNGAVPNDERLLGEVGFFGFHKNAFRTINCRLKITDKSYIIFNEKFTIYIKREDVLSIKKNENCNNKLNTFCK